MLTRLDEIETDLLARRERAKAEGWRGDIEGLGAVGPGVAALRGVHP